MKPTTKDADTWSLKRCSAEETVPICRTPTEPRPSFVLIAEAKDHGSEKKKTGDFKKLLMFFSFLELLSLLGQCGIGDYLI